ncbi:redoxin domain-containing protein [Tautonia sociabilis]|uniref:Redoxin domain-containing protein n=2 Tax=Tautonia sociabilis TaxID=2080755 RepID=A0A432MLG5_9BACT|nr:redoxin domain-containing protein [Tautonia sociabilis]
MSVAARVLGCCVALSVVGRLGPAGPVVAQPMGGEPVREAARSAEEWIARFRAGWEATQEHMRPLDDRGWKTRMRVLQGLVRLGPGAVPVLVAALDDNDPEVRVLAAQALAYLADPRADAGLERTLAGDEAPAARLYAADALGAIGGLEPSPLLERVESEDANRDVRAHVRFALERDGKPLDEAIRDRLRSFDLERMDSARVGEAAPDFTLTDALGNTYRLSDFRGERAVVLVFIYGDT